MAEYLIQDATLTELADAIRERNNTAETIPVADMARQIREGAEDCKKHIDTSKVWNWSYYCYNGARLETLPYIDTSEGRSFERMFTGAKGTDFEVDLNCQYAGNMQYMFYNSDACKIKLHFSNGTDGNAMMTTSMASAFRNASGITEITITGKIYVNSDDLHFAYCAYLTVESLVSILNSLVGNPDIPYTVYLGNTNINKLTEEQKAIATNKNIILG